MRKFVLFLGGSFLIMMSVALVDGQQPGGKKTGGFGGFGGPSSPLTLLNRDDVKEELKLTETQTEKLPAEVMVAISRVLDEKQFKRFKQIELQTRGNNAFKDKALLKDLKASDDQSKNIASILEESDKEIAELRKGMFGKGGGGFGKGGNEKIETARKDAKEKILTVLTKDQRKAWREMIGEEFKMTQPTFTFPKKGTDKKEPAKDK